MFKNKKIVRAVALTLGLTITFSTPSYAFNSKGKIQYQNGSNSVVFDANDFSLIQNNITTGKQNIVDALKSIKSYMKADGSSVTGTEPTDKYTGNVADLTFTQLANAIKNSQKIPSGKTAATADNITAGKSVWVDGQLITGNGSDNAAYRNQGKQEGINQTKVGTATAANVLAGKTFTNSTTVGATGTMKNNGAVTGSITTSGGSYTIPAGYHNGSGKVTGPTLAALVGTSVTLTSNANLLTGNTAYGKNGVKYTGTMPNKGAVTGSITTSGGSYTIPAGYHNGSGKVTGPTLAALVKNSNVTLNNASNLLSGVTAYGKDGVKYTGSMANRGAWNNTPTSKGKVTIPAGYHNGSGYVDTSGVYAKGYTDGKAEAVGSANITYTYHKHIGSATTNGGCYTSPVYHSHTSTCNGNCPLTVRYVSEGAPGTAKVMCDNGHVGYRKVDSQNQIEDQVCNATMYVCGKTGVIESYSLSCGKDTSTIESATIIY